MFFGEYRHSLDGKGRMTVPGKFRELLGEDFVMTKGLDDCLFLYPQGEWKRLEVKLKELPMTNREARAFVRFFFSGAAVGGIDKQGRVLIPQHLRNYAHLEKDVVVTGVATRVEVWDQEKWDAYTSDDSLSYDAIAEHMSELGI